MNLLHDELEILRLFFVFVNVMCNKENNHVCWYDLNFD